MSRPERPTFLVLGATKAGTTSVHRTLGQHPDVFVTSIKEPRFFDVEYERGPGYYMSNYFNDWSSERAAGESRAVKLSLPFVAARIKATMPDARLVAILRHPAERAYSHWWMKKSEGYETMTFTEAVRENGREDRRRFEGTEGARLWASGYEPIGRKYNAHRTYLDEGYYDEHLERYYALFSREQVLAVLHDDLKRDPIAVIRMIWLHIGVDPDAVDPDVVSVNVARPAIAAPLLRAWRRRRISDRIPPTLLRLIRKAASRMGNPPMLSVEERRLLVGHYAPHVRRLEKILGRELPAWYR